jgi:hypothetical protein
VFRQLSRLPTLALGKELVKPRRFLAAIGLLTSFSGCPEVLAPPDSGTDAGPDVPVADGGFIVDGTIGSVADPAGPADGFQVVEGGFEKLGNSCAGAFCVHGAIEP